MKLNKFITKILVILLIISIIAIIIAIFKQNKFEKQISKYDEIYNYINTDALENCNGLFNYSDKIVNSDDVKDDIKLCLAYHKSEIKEAESVNIKKDKKEYKCTKDNMTFRLNDDDKECTYKKVKKEIIDSTYKKIFGNDPSTNVKSFQVDNEHICFNKNDEYYYCGLSETFTYVIGNNLNIFRIIEKIEEKSSELVIYDYFMKIYNNKCYKSFDTTTVDEKCTNNYKNTKKVKYGFMKKNGSLYKHVYKKNNDDTYYWVSSEPVK